MIQNTEVLGDHVFFHKNPINVRTRTRAYYKQLLANNPTGDEYDENALKMSAGLFAAGYQNQLKKHREDDESLKKATRTLNRYVRSPSKNKGLWNSIMEKYRKCVIAAARSNGELHGKDQDIMHNE